MRTTSYVDEEGRHHAVQLPEGVSEEDASKGIPLGPPSLEPLGLPKEQEIRLHNQLFSRRLFTAKDVRKRRVDVLAALMWSFKVNAEAIVQIYLQQQEVSDNGRHPGFRQIAAQKPSHPPRKRTPRR